MSINFKKLEEQIANASKEAFVEVVNQAKEEGEKIYSFALYSDEGAMTICPSANTEEYYQEQCEDGEDPYMKFEPFEWKYEGAGAPKRFKDLCTVAREEADRLYEEDDEFESYQEKLYNTCIDVLVKLKGESFFEKTAGYPIFLYFAVSEYEFEDSRIESIVKRLNSDNEYCEEFLQWIKTWG